MTVTLTFEGLGSVTRYTARVRHWPVGDGADKFMGAAYWIPTFWVPALLVTHYVTFVYLLRYWKEDRWLPSSRSSTT